MTRVLATALALCVALLLSAVPSFAQSADGPVVQRITVEGTQRIEESTVLSYMVIREGQPYTQALVDQSLKTLFGEDQRSSAQPIVAPNQSPQALRELIVALGGELPVVTFVVLIHC